MRAGKQRLRSLHVDHHTQDTFAPHVKLPDGKPHTSSAKNCRSSLQNRQSDYRVISKEVSSADYASYISLHDCYVPHYPLFVKREANIMLATYIYPAGRIIITSEQGGEIV